VVSEDRWSDLSDAQAGTTSRGQLQSWQAAPRAGVALLLVHLIFEYLRLHQILPIIGKLKVQTAVIAALLLIVIFEIAKGGVRLRRQSWLLLGFLALAVFTIIPAHNHGRAFQFAYGLALILIGYFAIVLFLRNQRDLKRFLLLLVGIHMYLAVKGILGYSQREFRYYGHWYGKGSTGSVGGSFLGDPNDLALAMIMILPFAIYLFRQTRSLPARIFWGAGSVVILLVIILTFSRGGFVGLTAMVLYWVVTSRNKGKAIGGLVLAVALVIAVAPPQYWRRIETIGKTGSGAAQGSAQTRWNNWAAARRMFYDSPIWGVGGHNFGVLLPEYAIEYSGDRRPTRWGRATHSMYFDLLSQFGLLGVLLIGPVLVLNFRDIKGIILLGRRGRCSAPIAELAESLRVSWVGFLVPAAFVSVLHYPHLYYLTALTVVVYRLAFVEAAATAIEPVGAVQEA